MTTPRDIPELPGLDGTAGRSVPPPSEAGTGVTPMFAQYLGIKANYPDALLFFRMGDFYELFYKDAEIAARELRLTLTSRNPHAENPIPMCGVPWHAAQTYANELIRKGYNVAVCDQTEDPRSVHAGEIVRREVTRVMTAGTAIEDEGLESGTHNYLGAAIWDDGTAEGAFTWADVSTGEWQGLTVRKTADLWQWVGKMSPRELLVPERTDVPAELRQADPSVVLVRLPERPHFDPGRARERILAAQRVQELGAVGLEDAPALTRACGALLAYLEQTQMKDSSHLAPFAPLNVGRHLVIDEITERNLELFTRTDGRKGVGTLRHVIDSTATPMGGRLLEETLRNPWRDAPVIRETQDAVAFLVGAPDVRESLAEALSRVYDIERLSTRMALNRTSPKDMCALQLSLAAIPAVRGAVEAAAAVPAPVRRLLDAWDDMDDLGSLLSKALVPEPPPQVTDGGLFRKGYDAELDVLIDKAENGEALLRDLLTEEQEALPKLKMGYNRVFGYYFELSKAAGGTVPGHFVRRQTLASCERYTTARLSALEQDIASASERRKALEYKLFNDLRSTVAEARPRLLFMAHAVAALDYWQSLATVAARMHWCRPELTDDRELHVVDGRHPVVEDIVGENAFVPNDVHMDDRRRLILITGPNMAGKSTILRQTAIICLLAQMGSFVPARSASIGLCDRIFSRVGASDNLARGRSTFMVEMMETARILRQAGRNSLVILDEIGRGTSTFDGLAIAWAVAEDLAGRAGGGVRTLFATHYHELTRLEGKVPGVHTMNVTAREQGDDIVFTRRLVPGPADRSYGVEVARLAGVPRPVVARARELLARLERRKTGAEPEERPLPGTLPGLAARREPSPPPPPPPHPVLLALRDLHPETMTPIEALNRLNEWKTLWGNDR